MISLTIDGKNVSVEHDCTALDAIRTAGIAIPTLCDHESLTPYGSCRLCTVEIHQRGKMSLKAACTLPARDGMKIVTSSQTVLRYRRLLVELMLARWPQSPTIGRIAGELGVDKTRFHTPVGKDNATIVDEHGCILCGRCVRLCNDVLKIGALGFEGRGAARRVTTPFAKPSDACMACGACSFVCPTGAIEHQRIVPRELQVIPSEFDENLAGRKPIYLPFPQAVPRVPVIDRDSCMYFQTGGCKVCEDNCEAQAIDHNQQDTEEQIDIGSIILATGFKTFDARKMPQYGYGRLPNVFTSLEIERMVNASGPSSGEVVMKNGQKPKSVGIIHCVGSRDRKTNEWCSRVCCMYSLKLAHLVKERTDAQVFNFYIDMRTPGKSYEEFYDKLLDEGVQFIRGRVAEVTDWTLTDDEEDKLVIRAEDTLIGATRRVPVDMVILSVGMEPQNDAEEIRKLFNISCSKDGWFLERHPKLAPVATFTDGVWIAGACQGPRDIPDTVAHAGAAALEALSMTDRGYVEIEPNTASVDEDQCSGCKTCISLCPFNAIERDEEKAVAVINEALCKGCGTCVAACPSAAIKQYMFTDEQIYQEINGILDYI